MIFSCTQEEWMARTRRTLGRHAEWHNWFAWRPVKLPDGRSVWLQWVRRKRKIAIFIKITFWVYCLAGQEDDS